MSKLTLIGMSLLATQGKIYNNRNDSCKRTAVFQNILVEAPNGVDIEIVILVGILNIDFHLSLKKKRNVQKTYNICLNKC